MKKFRKLSIILMGITAMVVTLSTPMGLYANDSLIDASNYEANREALEENANRDKDGRRTTIPNTTTKDYTYGTFGRIHIDGWNVEVLSTNIESDGYHTITFKADQYYVLPEVSSSGSDVRFANVQSYMSTGNSYTVNEDKTIGTLRFKPNAERDTFNGTPILIRLVGISEQYQGPQSSYLSSYVFKDIRHSAIEFTGEEKAAGISFQLEGSKTYFVKANTDLKVYPTVNPWFKPIETATVHTGVDSSIDFSNRYYIIKGTNGDSTGDMITYDATAFSLKVYNGHTGKWEVKNTYDFYHADQTITMPDVNDPSIYYDGYRVNGFNVQRLVYEPKMAILDSFTAKETVGLDYTIQTNAADYNKQWVSTGIDPTRDENRLSSLRHREGDIFVSATWIKTYNVTFVDYNGTNLSNQVIDKGNDATAPADPVREDYTFTGWDKPYVNIQGDVVITATYSENPKEEKVNVTFVDYDGTNLSNQVIDKGSDAIAPADPVREGYTFTGWDKAYTNVQSDLVVSAMYSENPQAEKVNVTFVDYNGTNLSNQVIDKGSDAIAPANPTRAGYTFAGWDKAFTNVQSDLVVVATYTPSAVVTPPTEIPPAETPNTPNDPVAPVVNVTTPEVDVEQVAPEQTVPEKEEEKDTVVVEKQDTPKAKGDTGSWALLNLIATILTAVVAIILMLAKHKKEDKEDKNYAEGKVTVQSTRRRWTKVVSVLVSIIAIVLFILTEDMSLPMAIVDKWTILMVVIFLVQVVIFFVGRKWRDHDEDEKKQQGSTTLNQGTI